MNTILWIVTAVLAVAFTLGGVSQLLLAKEKYRALGPSQHWVDDFGAGQLKAIGTVKITGCVGLVAPAVFGIAPVLVPLAASGLMLFMSGAVTTRFRRGEWGYLAGDALYLGLFAFVAWGRFALSPL